MFKSGDIVQLKSGGPKMTVEKPSVSQRNSFVCQWFAGAKLEYATFHEGVLQPVEEKK